jgi:AcrR family transcriptional regulator
MSPRPYDLGKRNAQISEGRRQILDAALASLGEATSYTDFTVDAVAKRADVARGTVYYQFKSKTGLLEALCDELGHRGGLQNLAAAFTHEDPIEALTAFVEIFAEFWKADRAAMRRLRALAALDPEVRDVIAARDHRRHHGLNVIVSRLVDEGAAPTDLDQNHAAQVLTALTSFETFDALNQPETDLLDAVPDILALTATALRLTHTTPAPNE